MKPVQTSARAWARCPNSTSGARARVRARDQICARTPTNGYVQTKGYVSVPFRPSLNRALVFPYVLTQT